MDTVLTRTASSLTARERVLLTLLATAILLPGTFGVSLVDRDEGWYAQVSREMAAGGDWLIPHYLGQPWIAKPPLLYWCVAAVFRLFGPNVGLARLVSVIAATGATHLVATLAAELYGRRAAWFASICFITAGLPTLVGKMLLTDGLLLLWIMSAAVALRRIAARALTIQRASAFWLFIGLGALTKGPAILVFVGALGLALLTSPPAGRSWLRRPLFWATALVAAVVAAPWYLLAARYASGALIQQFFWHEIGARLVGTPHGHGGPPGYYVLLSLAGWLPWTPLVPGAVFEAWRDRRSDPAARRLLIWALVPWTLLECVPSKLPHYILPCYVPLAILLGRMWDRGLERPITRVQGFVLGLWVAVLVVLGGGLVTAGLAARGEPWSTPLIAAGVVLLLACTWSAYRMPRGCLACGWRAAAGSAVGVQWVLGFWLLPAFEPYRLSRNVANAANAVAARAGDPHAPVLVSGYVEPSVFFYLERPGRVIRAQDAAAALANELPAAALILREDVLAANAGAEASAKRGGTRRVNGFNYVKGQRESVWVLPPADATPHPTTTPFGRTPHNGR